MHLKDLLAVYGNALGQNINFGKSTLMFSPNIHLDRQKYLHSILCVVLVNDLSNYLGLSFYFSQRTGQNWVFLKDRIWKVI